MPEPVLPAKRHRIVEILRILPVDCYRLQLGQIKPTPAFLQIQFLRYGLRLRKHFLRILYRNSISINYRKYIDAGIIDMSEKLCCCRGRAGGYIYS